MGKVIKLLNIVQVLTSNSSTLDKTSVSFDIPSSTARSSTLCFFCPFNVVFQAEKLLMVSHAVLESMSLTFMPYLIAWVRWSVFIVSLSGPIPVFINFWIYCFTLSTSGPPHWALIRFANAKSIWQCQCDLLCFGEQMWSPWNEIKFLMKSIRAMAPRQCQTLVGALLSPELGPHLA